MCFDPKMSIPRFHLSGDLFNSNSLTWHMGLSENRVYSQWNSHLIGIMIINHWVIGVHYFQTHPYFGFLRENSQLSKPWEIRLRHVRFDKVISAPEIWSRSVSPPEVIFRLRQEPAPTIAGRQIWYFWSILDVHELVSIRLQCLENWAD